MTFDIYALDEQEDYDGVETDAYQDALFDLFAASQEGQTQAEINPEMGFWVYQSMYYAHAYIGVTLPQMDVDDMGELLLEVFPRKISTSSPDELKTAVPEIVAFWQYLQRVYNLPNAESVLAFLQQVEPKFIRAMNDPAKFGMAKSFFVQGQDAGFDMTDETQMNQFMLLYNLAARQGKEEGLPLPPNIEEMLDVLHEEGEQSKYSPAKRNKSREAKKKKKKQRRRR